jgi:hypothetical protein
MNSFNGALNSDGGNFVEWNRKDLRSRCNKRNECLEIEKEEE